MKCLYLKNKKRSKNKSFFNCNHLYSFSNNFQFNFSSSIRYVHNLRIFLRLLNIGFVEICAEEHWQSVVNLIPLGLGLFGLSNSRVLISYVER